MIWHIFKKDLRLHYLAVVVLTTVQIAAGVWYFFNDDPEYVLMVRGMAFFGTVFLIVLLMREDPIPGYRQDWLVRPIRRRDMLLAKLLFVALAIQGPAFLGNLLNGLANGDSPGQSLGRAAVRSGYTLAAFSLPWLSAAALWEGPMAMAASSVAIYMMSQVFGANVIGVHTGLDWVTQACVGAVILLACVIVLPVVYFRRAAWTGRMLLAGALVVCFSMIWMPWNAVFAIQQQFSSEPGAAAGITLRPIPSSQGIVFGIGDVPANSMLYLDHTEVRAGGARLPTLDDSGTIVNERLYQRGVRGVSGPLTLDYSLTLLRLTGARSIPASNGVHLVPGVGRCVLEPGVYFDCLDQRMPSCHTLSLGSRDFDGCTPDYAPFEGLFVLHTHGGRIQLRDDPDARLVMRIYKAVDHFQRRLVIPSVSNHS